MSKIVNTTIEILGKYYPIRCPEGELQALQQAAQFLNQKMIEVQTSGKVINLERIAIIAGLNITYQFLQQGDQKEVHLQKINQRINHIQTKLDAAIDKGVQTELVYTSE